MAKRNRKYKVGKWQPEPGDAINLATIRWFAIMIEAKAIEIYGTNPLVYPKILNVLNDAFTSVSGISVKKPIADPGDCPPGWVTCGEDCAPRCMLGED
ncbi:MAG TPA: hypothetical protein VN700_15190 [Vicinamibacterales bacterium]|nr:hypothetical protein [Vicinamibacterales bacterium]